MEVWKEITGYEGLYQVSNEGEVKNLRLNIIMKPSYCKGGYLKVKLSTNGKQKTIQIHRLVAENFIDNPQSKPQVNHKDCNKINNHVNNLEWATAQENIDHAIKNGLIGEQSSKEVFKIDRKGNVLHKYSSMKEAARDNNCFSSNIYKACNGLIKTTGGYIWRYVA